MSVPLTSPRRGAQGDQGQQGQQGQQGIPGTSGFKDRIWFSMDEVNPVFIPSTASQCNVPYILYDENAPFNGKAYGCWFQGDWGEGLFFTASDDGITWDAEVSIYNKGVDGPTSPVVHYLSTRTPKFIMWYWYGDEDNLNWSAQKYLESADGISWSNEQDLTGITLAPGTITQRSYGHRDVIYNASATNTGTDPRDYTYMAYIDFLTNWALASGNHETIGVAYSPDAIDWTFKAISIYANQENLGDLGDTGDLVRMPPYNVAMWNAANTYEWNYNLAYCSVVKESDTLYRALYGGGSNLPNYAIGQALSFDGLNWHDHGLSVDFPMILSDLYVPSWCDSQIAGINLVLVDSTYYAYFTAGQTSPAQVALGRATERTS